MSITAYHPEGLAFFTSELELISASAVGGLVCPRQRIAHALLSQPAVAWRAWRLGDPLARLGRAVRLIDTARMATAGRDLPMARLAWELVDREWAGLMRDGRVRDALAVAITQDEGLVGSVLAGISAELLPILHVQAALDGPWQEEWLAIHREAARPWPASSGACRALAARMIAALAQVRADGPSSAALLAPLVVAAITSTGSNTLNHDLAEAFATALAAQRRALSHAEAAWWEEQARAVAEVHAVAPPCARLKAFGAACEVALAASRHTLLDTIGHLHAALEYEPSNEVAIAAARGLRDRRQSVLLEGRAAMVALRGLMVVLPPDGRAGGWSAWVHADRLAVARRFGLPLEPVDPVRMVEVLADLVEELGSRPVHLPDRYADVLRREAVGRWEALSAVDWARVDHAVRRAGVPENLTELVAAMPAPAPRDACGAGPVIVGWAGLRQLRRAWQLGALWMGLARWSLAGAS